MAIIYLTVSSRQQWLGHVDPVDPVCPHDPSHRLVKDGQYTRHADSIPPDATLVIQRYYCRSCATTDSALPYDLRPYSTATWGVTLAVGVVWRGEYGWTWADCQQWLTAHGLPYHLRTLQRWQVRWEAALSAIVQAAVQWIAQHLGTRALAVFPGYVESPIQHWRRLWRAVRDHVEMDPAARRGGWIGASVLWGWLSITFCAGLSPG
ncbi:MAG: hypothetical protein M0Z53_12085 [Thermaerobacter sp.]|nr:hypothetical protein [Thermaerobacter sp.]